MTTGHHGKLNALAAVLPGLAWCRPVAWSYRQPVASLLAVAWCCQLVANQLEPYWPVVLQLEVRADQLPASCNR